LEVGPKEKYPKKGLRRGKRECVGGKRRQRLE